VKRSGAPFLTGAARDRTSKCVAFLPMRRHLIKNLAVPGSKQQLHRVHEKNAETKSLEAQVGQLDGTEEDGDGGEEISQTSSQESSEEVEEEDQVEEDNVSSFLFLLSLHVFNCSTPGDIFCQINQTNALALFER
jgi:hypothetical protein